ncbi:MAG: heat-inducible transcriptional repressor HrcA [Cyanobacteria bacterium P01_F01_bin.42]
MDLQLTQRQEDILRATVKHYISTAEPVGSKAIAHEYHLKISPATIRNDMGRLERSGLLFQPHTSAGRIPSDSGYRLYVDQLMTPSALIAAEVVDALAAKLAPQKASLEGVLRHAAQILSQLTGCLALVTLPQAAQVVIRNVQLVRVATRRAMFILITENYQTQSAVIDLNPDDEDGEDLERELKILTNFLNHHLVGQSLRDVQDLNWQVLGQEFDHYAKILQEVCADLTAQIQPQESGPVLFGGLSEVLRQPEFTEFKQAHTLIHFLEEQNAQLWPLMWQWPTAIAFEADEDAANVSIRIGSENDLEPIQSCALISTTYQHGRSAQGCVGIMGPTRMAYEKVIPMVQGTSSYLSQAFA